jgi:hypothetical protein
MGTSVSMHLSSRLSSGIDQEADTGMKAGVGRIICYHVSLIFVKCLDILADFLRRFGAEVMQSLGGGR